MTHIWCEILSIFSSRPVYVSLTQTKYLCVHVNEGTYQITQHVAH